LDIIHIITLAIIQGLTEFLPISSSAHLILLPQLTGWPDQGLAFDVAVHVGSLSAVLIYFRKDLKPLLTQGLSALKTRQLTPESRLVWGVVLATVPVALLGLMLSVFNWDDYLRTPLIIAITTIFFGLLLGLADITGRRQRDEYSLTWHDMMVIGLAQALALIPGTSRSGITMTAALFLGLNRQAAARFSFLLAIPVIILAGLNETLTLIEHNTAIIWFDLLLSLFFSALSAYLCIWAFIRLLERLSFFPFVLYRLVLGIALFIWIS